MQGRNNGNKQEHQVLQVKAYLLFTPNSMQEDKILIFKFKYSYDSP